MVARGRNPAVPRRTLRVGGYPVVTTVTANPGVARRWLYNTLWRERHQLHSAAGLTVGLGVQWTPSFRNIPGGGSAEPRPGTLQLCAGDRCLVYQIAWAGSGGGGAVPTILRRFLADARVTFAAYGVASDRRKLRAHHGLEVASTLELRGAAGMGNASMAAMADRLLGIRGGGVEKSRRVSTSTWDAARLSGAQVRYACVDAFLSRCLGEHIRRDMESDDDEYDDYDDSDSVAGEESDPDAVHGGYWG